MSLINAQAFGTTYYVDSVKGSDSNSGTSKSAPWQTISKVSKGPYSAGDSILFLAGDTWSGSTFSATLTTPSAGTSANQITYGTYGTGAAPILDGGGNLGTLISISQNYITVNGLQLQNAASHLISFANRTGTEILNVTGYNAGLWAFYGGSGGATTGATTISENVYKQLSSSYSTSIVFLIEGSSQTAPIIITGNTCDETAVSASPAICIDVNGLGNATIQYNQIYGGGQGISLKPRGGTGCLGPAQSGGLVADNYISGINRNGGTSVDGEGTELEGCSGYPQSNIVLARNIYICAANSSDAFGSYYSDNDTAYGNIVIGPCGSGSGSSTPRMVAWNSSSTNVNAYNNTFVGDGTVSNLAGILFSPGCNGSAYNNIFKHLPIGVSAAGSGTEDYNIYDSDVTKPTSGSVTSGGHSKTKTSPVFVSSTISGANDVKLKSGSPAIGAGTNVGSLFSSILNPLATSVPYGTYDESASWMMGAFGYSSAGVPLRISGAIVVGAIVPAH